MKSVLAAGLLTVATSGYAVETTLIDFEGQEEGWFTEVLVEDVTFSMSGAKFDVMNVFEFLESEAILDSTISNTILGVEGVSSYLKMSFEESVSSASLSMWASSYFSSWQLDAFDSANQLIDSVEMAFTPERGFGRFGEVTSSLNNISYATLTQTVSGPIYASVEDNLMIDNFKYASVSSVSEPSTYALMLGALGLVGFMASRRSKKMNSTAI